MTQRDHVAGCNAEEVLVESAGAVVSGGDGGNGADVLRPCEAAALADPTSAPTGNSDTFLRVQSSSSALHQAHRGRYFDGVGGRV